MRDAEFDSLPATSSTPSIRAHRVDAIGHALHTALTGLHPGDLLCAVRAFREATWTWEAIADVMLTDPETVWERYHRIDPLTQK